MPQGTDWDDFAALVRASLPNYLVSQLGTRFDAVFYRHMAGQPGAYSISAYDEAGNLAGCIFATLDRRVARRLTLPLIAKLIFAANFRLLSPAMFGWLVRGIRGAKQTKSSLKQFPEAELIIFVVAPAFRGEGLAPLLMGEMEAFFEARGLRKPYLILTEKENLTANRYYDKIGAEFIRTYQHHGREINIWHKCIA